MAFVVRAYPLFPSVDRVAPRKAGLPAQPARQPLGEEPQHGALSCYAVPGHGNYLCVTITTWLGVLLCDPAAPLPGASRTGRASSLPCSRYPITQLLPSLWLSPAPGGHMGVPPCEGGASGGQIALQAQGPRPKPGKERLVLDQINLPSSAHTLPQLLRCTIFLPHFNVSHVIVCGVS